MSFARPLHPFPGALAGGSQEYDLEIAISLAKGDNAIEILWDYPSPRNEIAGC